jgi:hypothetical protein
MYAAENIFGIIFCHCFCGCLLHFPQQPEIYIIPPKPENLNDV